MVVVVTIGFVNDVHYVDDSGFNVYHKNRLIKLGFVMINNDKHNYVLCEAYLLSPFQNFCGPSASEIMKNTLDVEHIHRGFQERMDYGIFTLTSFNY